MLITSAQSSKGTEKQRNGDYYPDVVPCKEIIETGAKAPVFLETLLPETIVKEGDDMSLFCVIKGVPTPCVIWLYNQLIVEESALCSLKHDGPLEIRDAFSNSEDYLDHGFMSVQRCASRTSSISSWSETFKPSFTQKLKFRSVLEGDPAVFQCKLIACPTPAITWFHNNRPIPKDLRRIITMKSDMHIHSSSLEVRDVQERDSGSYKVFAINSEGSAESTASLLVAQREEQNAKYLDFLRKSKRTHESIEFSRDLFFFCQSLFYQQHIMLNTGLTEAKWIHTLYEAFLFFSISTAIVL
uniref:Ig-like domain-containing protein n=1 Tax=Gopherus agassizii TaxID=38772 RepID=A0A452HGF2_9SAUR